MYNRYIPKGRGHVPVSMEEIGKNERQREVSSEKKYTPLPTDAQERDRKGEENFSGAVGETEFLSVGDKSAGLKRLLKLLRPEWLDNGDVLLFLILLLLLTDGDDLDMLIALALILLFGIGEKKSPDSGGLSGLFDFL